MSRHQLVLTSLLALVPCGIIACDPGHVGDPCVPEDEYRTNFSNFAATETYVESRSFQCETRLCLVNHFQGRVSCPYGQAEDDLASSPDAPERCRVPGTNGSRQEESIDVPVKPWLVERPANETVYCSCRCDGPDPSARYCECPTGYACEELVPEVDSHGASDGRRQLAGSYCIKDGTKYAPGGTSARTCRDDADAPGCPDPRGKNP